MVRSLTILSLLAACSSPSPAPIASGPPLVGASSAFGASASGSASAAGAVMDASAPNAKARVDLTARKSAHFLGENVLVDFCVVNTSGAPITLEVGGDYRGSSRSLRFKLDVRDARGVAVADPDPNPMNFGGMSYSPKLGPSDKWCASLPLVRYARIDAPGTYTVRATHDLGWPAGTAPSGTVSITFAMPNATEAESVIAAMEALPKDTSSSAGKVSPAYPDFSALRYEVYVAPLAARANKGVVDAIDGLASIPTANATRALVALLGHGDHAVARAAARGLAMRLPDPALGGALGKRNPFANEYDEQRRYLSTQSWVPALTDDVRRAAKVRLASADVRDQQDGAFMLEAVGTTADAAELVKALDVAIDRTRTVPAETDLYPVPRGACQELLRAAEILVARGAQPAATPKSPGEIALWLVALSHASPRPRGWEAQLDAAMKHAIPFVRALAMDHVPASALPASLLPSVVANLAHPDLDVVVSAATLAEREKTTTIARDVVRAMARPTGLRLNIVSNAAQSLGARWDATQALIARLSEKPAFDEAMGELIAILDEKGHSSNGETGDAERAALRVRWKAFVTLHRADVEAGRKVALADPSVTKDLMPSNWKLLRADGTEWP